MRGYERLTATEQQDWSPFLHSQKIQAAAPGTSMLQGYLPSLDGWRAIAISIVLLFHSADALILAVGAKANLIGDYRLLGVFGVDIFFAISGLLITSRLLAEEATTGSLCLKSFYIRRAFRILPPSLTYLAVIVLLGAVGAIGFNLRDWTAALLFYVNFLTHPLWYVGHFWSLAVEEHYYAVWPAVLLFVKGKPRLKVALVMTLVIAAWRAFNVSAIGVAIGSSFYGHENRTDFQVDSIVWGATAALFYQQYSEHRLMKKLMNPYTAVVLFAIVLVSLIAHIGWKTEQTMLMLRSIFIPLILLSTIRNSNPFITSFLERPWLRWIGKLSYSLYLWQQLFLVWGVQNLGHIPLVQRFPFNLCCAFACATLSYYFIEKPLIRIGHRVASRYKAKEAPVLATLPG